MKHFDEHQLELYVLNAPEVTTKRREIAAHLKKCAGCKEIAGKLSEFYKSAESELRLQPSSGLDANRALVLRHADLAPFYEASADPIAEAARTRLERFRHFARRHPLAAGTGSFAVLAIVAALIALSIVPTPKDTNPDYYHLNIGQGMFEVYNQEHQKLWQIPAASLSGVVDLEREHNISLSRVVDVDGDGKNEVITAIPFLGSDRGKGNILHVLSANGKLLKSVDFGEAVHFRGAQYDGSNFGASAILVEDFAGSGHKEIIVAASNIRSPFLVERFDANGRSIGQYWHLGVFFGAYVVDLMHDGRKQIILCGVNDVNTRTNGGFASIVVLDPTMIIGKTESACSPGFGLTPSNAELFYIRLPRSDIGEVIHSKEGAILMRSVRWDTVEALSFWQYGSAPPGLPIFEYVFSKTLNVLSVKPEDRSIKLRDSVVQQGKLKGAMDTAYLNRLKEGVRYWDGKEWNSSPVRVGSASVRGSATAGRK